VRIAERRIWIGNQSRPLLHGEVHFWRLSPARWRDVLRSARDLGLDMVSTYVCWDFHERAPGDYDFRGATDPQRDLIRYIEVVAAEGLKNPSTSSGRAVPAHGEPVESRAGTAFSPAC